MSIRLERYCDARIPAVHAFNARIASAVPYAIGTGPARPPSQTHDQPLFVETLLAVEGDDVRGGIMIQHQAFSVGGALRDVVNIQLPLSEGVVDRRYAYLGMWLIQSVVKRHPFAFAVGMGGLDQPLPKVLKAMGWSTQLQPFYFHVHRAAAFLSGMPMLNDRPLRRFTSRFLASTGLGRLTFLFAQRMRSTAVRSPLVSETISEWTDWADEVWRKAAQTSSMMGVRDSQTLRLLYPKGEDRNHYFRVRDGSSLVGWIALRTTRMKGSPKFGDLYVGTLLDALAVPGYEVAVAHSARRLFDDLGVDISVANHSHATWCSALTAARYLRGRSNYVLALSKQLSEAVQAASHGGMSGVHVTRGDGDGRIHL